MINFLKGIPAWKLSSKFLLSTVVLFVIFQICYAFVLSGVAIPVSVAATLVMTMLLLGITGIILLFKDK